MTSYHRPCEAKSELKEKNGWRVSDPKLAIHLITHVAKVQVKVMRLSLIFFFFWIC